MTEKLPTIVVIDDSPTSISLYQLSTGPLEVELKVFESPADALVYLEEHKVDLVFLDILMQAMDGLTVLKKLRGMTHHEATRVVMVTSKDYAEDRAIAKKFGAHDFLVKPLRSQEIRDISVKYTHAECRNGANPNS